MTPWQGKIRQAPAEYRYARQSVISPRPPSTIQSYPHRARRTTDERAERLMFELERLVPSIAELLEPVLYPDGPWRVEHRPARQLP